MGLQDYQRIAQQYGGVPAGGQNFGPPKGGAAVDIQPGPAQQGGIAEKAYQEPVFQPPVMDGGGVQMRPQGRYSTQAAGAGVNQFFGQQGALGAGQSVGPNEGGLQMLQRAGRTPDQINRAYFQASGGDPYHPFLHGQDREFAAQNVRGVGYHDPGAYTLGQDPTSQAGFLQGGRLNAFNQEHGTNYGAFDRIPGGYQWMQQHANTGNAANSSAGGRRTDDAGNIYANPMPPGGANPINPNGPGGAGSTGNPNPNGNGIWFNDPGAGSGYRTPDPGENAGGGITGVQERRRVPPPPPRNTGG